ncbi:MAG: hypothetical protein V1495_06465 [Pseudomonadota bacterium]
MTFNEITRMMLNSMDFFELRRTAARYAVPYQGVRRQKLIRDLERKILAKANPAMSQPVKSAEVPAGQTLAARSPVGAVSAKPNLERKPLGGTRINTFSARNSFNRF